MGLYAIPIKASISTFVNHNPAFDLVRAIWFIQHNGGILNHRFFEESLTRSERSKTVPIMIFNQQALNKAKIKIAFSGILCCIFFSAVLTSCKKELEQNQDGLTIAQDRSEVTPTITHGMLHFNSFADLTSFTQSLQNKEADTAQVRSAYLALGVDVNAEYLPNLTDYPICLLKEQAIGGYTSARKAEEIIINAALDNGDDNINSIVVFPFWKTALNTDRAVHIGNRIYKYYDNGGVSIVLNNDWTLYDAIKAQSFESLRESFNLIVTSDAREGWDHYFTFNTDQSINAEKAVFMPRFVVGTATGGNLSITNVSLVETQAGANTYRWIYSDNTTSTGHNPARTIAPNEAFTLIIDNGMGTKDTLTGTEIILACSVDNFTITYLSNGQIRFELPGYNPVTSEYILKWEFSDGSTSTANPVVKTFTSNGTATCQLFRKSDNSLACQFTKPFTIKCGDKNVVSQTFEFDQGNQRWKLDGSIWVQTSQVGCKVKYLRWRGAILKWQPAYNQGACANLSGIYVREVNTPTGRSCNDITAGGSYCLGEGTFPTSVAHIITEVPNVFRKPEQLSAGLGIKVNGTWRGWGYAGKPRLVLP